ncbi:MAG: hypothetical protein ABSE90_11100 [Verrucomicrobiota bacterium]|jgi:hypothetical protein
MKIKITSSAANRHKLALNTLHIVKEIMAGEFDSAPDYLLTFLAWQLSLHDLPQCQCAVDRLLLLLERRKPQ